MRVEQVCFGSGTKAAPGSETSWGVAACADCERSVDVDAHGNVAKHVTGDPLCFRSRLGK